MAERKRMANHDGGRPVSKFVRLTEGEAAELTIASQRESKTVQRFMVEAGIARARGVDPQAAHEAITALFKVEHQLSKVGTNINQLTRHANATGEVLAAELREQLAHLRGCLDRLDETVDQVSVEARR
ncbi:plasmid mobilization relaxosome protein MobC [Micrococcus luteus]|uniref:plasmid mobilization relaxosome protein MobC n=1 Tax=Micrococcus luteus TaxID=1270 RepID=UPI00119A6E2C|nr:plasmid mobilization relaxosome protein MobC [Micrococcus luteus]TWH35477.1 mobilization protein MobC [Micrococcus luteus J28]